MRFSEMNLIEPLLRAVDEAGYTEPTPIQEQTIKYVLAGDDVLGCAQTGTGKTAAFRPAHTAKSLQSRAGSGRIRSLILTPTRELAIQNYDSFVLYGKYLSLRCGVIFGGVGQGPQEEMLPASTFLWPRPGRLNDLIGQGLIKLDGIEIFVLDEADRMLDMGFIHDVKPGAGKAAKTPADADVQRHHAAGDRKAGRQYAAQTQDREGGSRHQHGGGHRPVRVFVDKGNKKHLLAKVLRQDDLHSALVFTRTKHGADKVVKELDREGIEAHRHPRQQEPARPSKRPQLL
jgi:ATP-dependent RNA helicase RhlE